MSYPKESFERIEKLHKLKQAWIIPYANNFVRTNNLLELKQLWENKNNVKEVEVLMENWAQSNYIVAWRIMTFRTHGKLSFAKIKDWYGEIQLCFMRDLLKFNTWKEIVSEIKVGDQTYSAFKLVEKLFDLGDFIGVKWELFITKHWELTLFVCEYQLLSKSIRPLPEKYHGISDEDLLYRKRYLDLTMNDETYSRFKFRSEFIKTLRDFYYENWFVELETPILGNAASWAAAKPFITHHNDLDLDVYLRISPETALKKATVGRFEKVFEIARDFRNEWSDPSHLQEFTMVEHYSVYWNFEDNIKFTEKMFDYIWDKLNLEKKINIKDKEWNSREVDFTTPWQRIDYIQWVKNASWIDISQYDIWDEIKLLQNIKDKWIQFDGMDNMWLATLIDYMYKKVLRPKIVWPAIIYNYPKTMQPLARQSDDNPSIVEQFQIVVNWWEIVKAYSELVDPLTQKANFEAQTVALEKWDEETTKWDDDFVLAMEHGMPPQSWLGMWIDRLLTLILWQDNIRDVVLFPLMKPFEHQEIKTWKSKETMVCVAIINKWSGMEVWQELNTVAHLSAAYGAREWKKLFMHDIINTKDSQDIKLNTQHAIMIKQVHSSDRIRELKNQALELDLQISEFTKEMLMTSDDMRVTKMTLEKNYIDVEYLWLLIFGKKTVVDKITKQLDLYS